MIPAKLNNHLYFSSLLPKAEGLGKFWDELQSILDENKIAYSFLEKTDEIWCKEYMPLQTSDNSFVQFNYDPDFLKHSDTKKTNPIRVTKFMESVKSELSEIVLEGGGVVSFEKKIIITERVLKENSFIKEKEILSQRICELLGLKEVIILPYNKEDGFGQASSFIRFMNDNTVLLVENRSPYKAWSKLLDKAMFETDFHIIGFPGSMRKRKSKQEPITSYGCYIAFLQIGNTIIFPQFDQPEDDVALEAIKKIYPVCKIFPLDCTAIAEMGGLLNSIAWGVKK